MSSTGTSFDAATRAFACSASMRPRSAIARVGACASLAMAKPPSAVSAAAIRYGPVRYEPVTIDRFGRTVAVAYAGDVNLSCRQLQRAQAVYKPNWDNGHIIGRACR